MRIPRAATSRLSRAVKVGALTLLVVAALVASLPNLSKIWRVKPAPNVEMAWRDQRFEPLRNALPKRGTVGYLSDAANGMDHEMRIMLAEFSLAPLILVSGGDQELVVGDFTDPAAIAKGIELNLTVIRDFGEGVVLFARPRQ